MTAGGMARRINDRRRREDKLYSEGGVTPLTTAGEQARLEAINCTHCRKPVHPTNWIRHMQIEHPDQAIALHEAEPGKLPIAAIRADGGTQSREKIDAETVADYAEAMRTGVRFPPVTVFYDGADYWLADGFHRVEAAKQAGLTDCNAEVRQGTQRDAILHSVGTNAAHGLRRTNADKRRAVERLLHDDEWSQWSNREIARRCSVSHEFVNNQRASLATVASDNRTYTTKHGTTTTMQTGNIGKSATVQYTRMEDDYQDDVPSVQVNDAEPTKAVAEICPVCGDHFNFCTCDETSYLPDDGSLDASIKLQPQPALAEPGNYKRDAKTNHAANEYVPQGFDACQTPAYAIDPLVPYLGWSMPSMVWEPACGQNNLVEALYDAGWKEECVIGSDILTGQNFFEYEPDEWDIIVTNPPFSLKFRWLERCYALGKPFALLLPVETLGAKTAQELFKKYGCEFMFLDQRVDFKMPNAGWDGAGAQFPVMWVCWNLLPEKVMFGSIEEGKKKFKDERRG